MNNFNEKDHPREEDGKFAPKGEGKVSSGKKEDVKIDKETPEQDKANFDKVANKINGVADDRPLREEDDKLNMDMVGYLSYSKNISKDNLKKATKQDLEQALINVDDEKRINEIREELKSRMREVADKIEQPKQELSGIDYENVAYPKGTSKEYTFVVNKKYKNALPVLEKLGIKESDFGGKPSEEGGFEDNTKEIMDKYVFEPFNKKYPKGNNDAWEKEYQPIFDAIESVADKHYNDWYIKNTK